MTLLQSSTSRRTLPCSCAHGENEARNAVGSFRSHADEPMHRVEFFECCGRMLFAMTGIAADQNADSLLNNGGFEAGTSDNVPGWTRAFYPQRQGIERCVGPSSEQTHSGKRSLKIDTSAVLGEEVTLVFNGSVSPQAVALRGKMLILTGWIYVQPGAALRPIGIVLRAFGKDGAGKSAFLGTVSSARSSALRARGSNFDWPDGCWTARSRRSICTAASPGHGADGPVSR